MVIRHLKIHHPRIARREFEILITVMGVFALPFLLFAPDWSYYDWYIVGFVRSALVIFVLSIMISKVQSLRLLGLMFFTCVSMTLDLGSVFSTDFYWMIKSFRYEGVVNFKNAFLTYEVCCVCYQHLKKIFNFVVRSFDLSFDSDYDQRFNHLVCDLRIWLGCNIEMFYFRDQPTIYQISKKGAKI